MLSGAFAPSGSWWLSRGRFVSPSEQPSEFYPPGGWGEGWREREGGRKRASKEGRRERERWKNKGGREGGKEEKMRQ